MPCNTDAPTNEPTYVPTGAPTNEPTYAPTGAPTGAHTNKPTYVPTGTYEPTGEPTYEPTGEPTYVPTNEPTPNDTVRKIPACQHILELSNSLSPYHVWLVPPTWNELQLLASKLL